MLLIFMISGSYFFVYKIGIIIPAHRLIVRKRDDICKMPRAW